MLMCRSFWIEGSATFTTVLSSMIMNRPTAIAASVHHFRFSEVKSRARISGQVKERHCLYAFGYPYACAHARVRLDADARAGGERQPDPARPAPGRRALPRPPPHLCRGAGALLACADRGPGPRVLGAVECGGRCFPRHRVGALV